MASKPLLAEFFQTPLIVDRIDDAATLNADARLRIEARRAETSGMARSSRLGWQSDTAMFEWAEETSRVLIERVMALSARFTVDLGASGTPRYRWVPEIWANVSGHGASNQYHTHPGAYWSAVYYVDDGYLGSADSKLGGEIVFEDPRVPTIMMEAPDLRVRLREGFHDPIFQLRPETGTMLMFPSWLRHAVNPYLGQSERISIAINLTAIWDPVTPGQSG
jgi:uncharacterized protein (TIGR02466 family)